MKTIKRVLAGPWVPPELGKLPYLWAFSLGFLFWQYLYRPPSALELGLACLSTLLFLPLYFFSFWASDRQAMACIVFTCLVGGLWVPHNFGASSFFIFACGMCGRVQPPRRAYLVLAGVLAAVAIAAWFAQFARIGFLMSSLLIGIPVGIASIMEAGLRASRAQLMRKQEEVEHMARIAERERISRDLHDLLGHSLSLIALKAELAGKLAGRDADACRKEIRDIETSARQALSEVRAAVTGYRQSGLAGALASARASLAAANVKLSEDVQRFPLAPASEHVLALALREAVTNVVRHAGATCCSLGLVLEQDTAVLRVFDDGTRLRSDRDLRCGNGLAGMRERACALGGDLAIRVGAGLALELRVPAGSAA
ncbi:sensor histidine kinase [Massilia horti]|uniref:Sensor histidine kinase n=1 Tax=Massilia horti TaxID=2562153 RepID=A0A4Y9T4V7_9BURK|nr:sensor histidine kinase [Massilia horti]TFW35579.1 sensor histidine kinase [Massilia horti]